MFNRRILLAMAMAVLMSSSAWAGGNGGTKKDATISVRNDSGAPIAAFIDPNLALVNALPAVPTQAQIEAAGGKLVNAGATVKFQVKQGTYQLLAGTAAANTTISVSIGKAQTKRFAYTVANALNQF